MIDITPYKELLHGGEKSIYDYVNAGYKVADKVIVYLRKQRVF